MILYIKDWQVVRPPLRLPPVPGARLCNQRQCRGRLRRRRQRPHLHQRVRGRMPGLRGRLPGQVQGLPMQQHRCLGKSDSHGGKGGGAGRRRITKTSRISMNSYNAGK